jgi:hypothetical protein
MTASVAGFAAIAAVPVIHNQSPFHIRPVWFYAAAAAFLLGVLLRVLAPHLGARSRIVVECGNEGDDFRYVLTERDPRLVTQLAPRIKEIYTTRLRVRETNGIRAPEVEIRLLQPGSHHKLIQWVNEADRAVIGPHGRGFVRLCELFVYEQPGKPSLPRSAVAELTPGERVSFDIQVVVDGRIEKSVFTFTADWNEEQNYPVVDVRDA